LRNSTSYIPSICPGISLWFCMFSSLSKSFSPFPSHFSNHLWSTFSRVMPHRHALHFTLIIRCVKQ
jgi:hypothetical protein